MFQFGAKANSAQPGVSGTGANAFGNNTNTGSTGLFGNNNNAQQGFGGAQNTGTAAGQPTGGLFGGNNNTAASAPGATGGLFGNNTATQGTTTGMFGASNNTAQTAATGSTFGGNSGGLFGANNSNNNTNTFGNNNATGGGLFGNNTQTNTAPTLGTSGGLFGAAKPQSTLGGGLFGNNNQQQPNAGTLGGNTTGGLFGNKPAQPQTTLGGGLFGNNQQQQQQQPASAGFGLKSTQPSFAWSQQGQQQQQPQPQQSSLFGAPAQQQQQQFPNSHLMGSLNLQTPSSLTLQQQQSANYPQQIQDQIVKCKESWDPSSSKSKLRTFVYNKVDKQQALLYNKPNNIMPDEWDKALKNKPNDSVIPVELLGFEALNQRNQIQIENVAQSRTILKQLLEKNTQLQQRHELEIASRILKVTNKNVEIETRLLKLGSQLAILKNRGLPLNITEEKMWNQYKELLKRSEDPAGLGKTNELWARLVVLKERARNISDQLDNTMSTINQKGGSAAGSSVGQSSSTNAVSTHPLDRQSSEDVHNDMNIDKIAYILSNQQKGITYLKDVLDKDQATIENL